MADGNLSMLTPIIGSPKNINISCNNKGVPRITKTYKDDIKFTILIFDNLSIVTIIPKGIDKSSVNIKTPNVFFKPSIIEGIKVII